jgi:5-methylcytosine-specific restriction endonuclease McrA
MTLLPIERRTHNILKHNRYRAEACGTFIEPVTPGQLFKLLKKQSRQCAYCLCLLHISTFTLDHKIPLSRGGTHSLENFQLTCSRCNSCKGTQIDWKAPFLRNYTLLRPTLAEQRYLYTSTDY